MGEDIHKLKAEKVDQDMARRLIKMGQDNNNVLPPDAYANARAPDTAISTAATMDLSWMRNLSDSEGETGADDDSTSDDDDPMQLCPRPHTTHPSHNTPMTDAKLDSSDEDDNDRLSPTKLPPSPAPVSPAPFNRLKPKARVVQDKDGGMQEAVPSAPTRGHHRHPSKPQQPATTPPSKKYRSDSTTKACYMFDTSHEEEDNIPSTNMPPQPSPTPLSRLKRRGQALLEDSDEDDQSLPAHPPTKQHYITPKAQQAPGQASNRLSKKGVIVVEDSDSDDDPHTAPAPAKRPGRPPKTQQPAAAAQKRRGRQPRKECTE